jgi:copper resistance protein B
MRPGPALTAIGLALASPAFAQQHPNHPPPAPAPKAAVPASPAPAQPEEEAMPAMDWPTELPAGEASPPGMAGMDHGAHGAMAGADGEVGGEPPPEPPTDHAADALFGVAAMQPSRRQLAREHGGGLAWQVMIDQAEWRGHDGEDGYGWNGEAWYGGDKHRLVLKTEGEGAGGDLEDGELQLLYSRAISPYFDLQAGLRQDLRDGPPRTYLAVGIEGLAPYWLETEGAVFLSSKGEVFARLESSYDLRLTQRLILQPRVEAELSGQDVPELGVGGGLTGAEVGLRLRYEVKREFAPYLGVVYSRTFGDTADYARAAGQERDETSIVIGLRAWF